MHAIRSSVLWAGVLAMTYVTATPAAGGGHAQDPSRYPSQYETRGPAQWLRGTYELDVRRSDDPRRVSDMALRQLPPADRARIAERLINRLDPPNMLSVDRIG